MVSCVRKQWRANSERARGQEDKLEEGLGGEGGYCDPATERKRQTDTERERRETEKREVYIRSINQERQGKNKL